jgi:2,5-dioxopentanoate dehydrogenase
LIDAVQLVNSEENMGIHGKNIIGFSKVTNSNESSFAYNPVTGERLAGKFVSATPEDLDQALLIAKKAFEIYGKVSQIRRAEFLEAIINEIMNIGYELVERATEETALPKARIISERGRTTGQIQMFANLLRDGSWLEAAIDQADPEREPIPKADVRRMLIPLGPVGVFAASNFPLAFSVAGGDTISALAAGNPVIVKAHSGHLGTCALMGEAISKAAQKTGMADGVFSLLHGSGRTIGQSLVQHPYIKAVGFTGSTAAGKLLFSLANDRKEPIPVFAEMGSINPVFVTPEALKKRRAEIATLYAGSITLGVGQFCTNPGLIIGLESPELDDFIKELGKKIESIAPSTMLNKTVYKGFETAYENIISQPGVQQEGVSKDDAQKERHEARPTVTSVTGKLFLGNPNFSKEVFGPFSLVVKCKSKDQLHEVLENLEGQLTATIMSEEKELSDFSKAVDILNQKSGRILFNGVPTGVEVCAAMHHGGPFPAATDSRFTSVGTFAIKRFARPVAFQNWPESALPDELKNNNPLNIWRLVDNIQTKDAL